MSSALQSAPHLIDAEEFRSLSTKSNLDFDYANTSANDPALLIYTSGTTARPKGVLHGHQMAWGRRPMAEGWYGLTPNDRLMHAGAFNWTFTLGTGLIDPWMAGATAIINTGPRDPDIWPKLLKRTDATLFAAVPGLIRQILKYAGSAVTDLPSLRHAMIAGDTPPNGLFEDWQKATGTPLYEALGMSEISTYISCGPNVPRRPGAIGRPQAGRAVAILPETDPSTKPLPTGEIGLLAVHRTDPGLMLGYWNRNDEEREVFRGEWFIGGDLAEMDQDGYIIHHGRDNDVMKPLGYRIAPQEIEDVLVAHSGVAEAACTEVEIKNGVRVIAAFIVPEHPTSPPSEADLLKHANANLAAYKCPR
ncbi:MAG: fatty acid--CoA ligase family protein, partial [Pseudomonadota bacterium]